MGEVVTSADAGPRLDGQMLPLMTIGEAAAFLHVHLSTLRRWEKSGFLSSMRVGPRGHRRYSRSAILELASLKQIRVAGEAQL